MKVNYFLPPLFKIMISLILIPFNSQMIAQSEVDLMFEPLDASF